MKIIKECEICSNSMFTSKFKGKDKLLGIPGEFNLVKCNYCGVKFLNPQPTYKELSKHYNNKKYYSLKNINPDSFKTSLKISLYKLYFTQNKNYFCRIIFSPIKFMLRSAIIKKNKKLLDIGCGSGQFLYEMKELGLDVHGVEPGEFDETERLNIKKGDLIKVRYPDNYFDIITMNHVLEHLNNPIETIKEIKRILKPGGAFIVGVPNTSSLANKIFRKNWLAYDVPRHLFNYSNKLLVQMLKQNEFKINKVRYNSRPTQFTMSLYYVFNIKKRTGWFNNLLELFFIPFTLLVNFLHIGDQVEIICEK